MLKHNIKLALLWEAAEGQGFKGSAGKAFKKALAEHIAMLVKRATKDKPQMVEALLYSAAISRHDVTK